VVGVGANLPWALVNDKGRTLWPGDKTASPAENGSTTRLYLLNAMGAFDRSGTGSKVIRTKTMWHRSMTKTVHAPVECHVNIKDGHDDKSRSSDMEQR
jgi:hypothetical protein